jgi:urease accessory protein
MLRISSIVGHMADPDLESRVNHADRHGGVDIVTIQPQDLDRRRLKATTDKGREVAIAIPRDQKLTDGAILLLSHDQAVVVRAGAQRWLRLTPASKADAVELGYHAGNLHWRVRFDGADLLVACSGDEHSYLDRIRPMLDDARLTWGLERA